MAARAGSIPSEVKDERWIEIGPQNYNRKEESGKWMMYYHIDKIDQAWSRAVDLYHSGELPEIRRMLVSTAKPDDRYPPNEKVILFYCGPASNTENIMKTGRDLIKKMDYDEPWLYYSTEEQISPGVPASYYILTDIYKPGRADTKEIPTEVTNKRWLYVIKEKPQTDYFCPTDSGKWMLFYDNDHIDDAWLRAKTLFETGQLPDIKVVAVSTAMRRGYLKKLLMFVCGPASDEDKMKETGEHLQLKMQYREDQIYYKTDLMSMSKESGFLYTVDVYSE